MAFYRAVTLGGSEVFIVFIPKKNGIKTFTSLAFIVLIVYLTVFGGGDRIMSAIERRNKDSIKARFEELLEERYGEEFVCFEACYENTIGFDSPTFHEGVCAPKRDMNLVFEARSSIKDKKLIRDEYPAAIVGRQLSEEFSNNLDGVFGRCDVTCKMSSCKDNDEVIERVKDGTLDWEFFHTKIQPPNEGLHNYALFNVLVDSSELCGSYEEEWDAFETEKKKIVDAMRENGIEYTVDINLYFSPPDMYEKCLELLLSYENTTSTQLLDYINECEHEVGQHTKKYNRTMRVNDEYSRDKYIERRGNIDD